jgi:hypothetical protein
MYASQVAWSISNGILLAIQSDFAGLVDRVVAVIGALAALGATYYAYKTTVANQKATETAIRALSYETTPYVFVDGVVKRVTDSESETFVHVERLGYNQETAQAIRTQLGKHRTLEDLIAAMMVPEYDAYHCLIKNLGRMPLINLQLSLRIEYYDIEHPESGFVSQMLTVPGTPEWSDGTPSVCIGAGETVTILTVNDSAVDCRVILPDTATIVSVADNSLVTIPIYRSYRAVYGRPVRTTIELSRPSERPA